MLPHKSKHTEESFDLSGRKALIITTSQATLDKIDSKTGEVIKRGKSTGVYASEMTEPYYAFLDAGMDVTVASIRGGNIPIEKLSLLPLVRTSYDNRFLKDLIFQNKVEQSKSITDIDVSNYDIIFLSGGWGAAYDFAQSNILGAKISEAYAREKIIAAVCHGPLGLVAAVKPDGSPLVEGVKLTGVTNKQLKQLMVGETPKHPETELRKLNADYQSNSGFIDMFRSHIEIDKNHRIVTGQNQKCGINAAIEAMRLLVG
jgi:putative intracellular protease/amidase